MILLAISPADAQQPSPTPSCQPDRKATVVRPVAPEIPEALLQNNTGSIEALVLVTVDPRGKVKDAVIQKTSGYYTFDILVLRAARLSEYSPMIVNCQPTTGTYVFHGQFRTSDQMPTPYPTATASPTPVRVISPL